MPKLTINRHISIILLSTFLISGCAHVSTVTQIVDLARSVIELVNTFSDNNKTFTKKVLDITQITQDGIKEGKSLTVIANFWEKHWLQVNEDYLELRHSLTEVKSKSEEYFLALEKSNTEILNDSLRTDDINKTHRLRADWQTEYNKALLNLENVEKMLISGNDYKIILRNAAGRAELLNTISELQNIAIQAHKLSISIESFELSAKNIFQTHDLNRNEDYSTN